MMSKHRYVLTAASSTFALLSSPTAAQAPAEDDDTIAQVIVTGTRVADRSALETAAPVDVVSSEALQNLGVTEINQALSVALPSYSFPRPGLADGTDTIRPATLRGLAPDQTLVLVNGKRRHAAALVNVNATIGRGAAAVDLNTIPNRDREYDRSAARRRLGPVRLRRDCGCDQFAPARGARRRRHEHDLRLARFQLRHDHRNPARRRDLVRFSGAVARCVGWRDADGIGVEGPASR